ncbi:MAG: DUF1015 domain-containing protein [Clostridia bacterium]|nr:DUF1015 domain-containing protein [Clostridia bacterium]
MKNVFGKTDILLPRCAPECEKWETWSVIACDQHTSEPAYWEQTEQITEGVPSTLGLILPEAYLGTEKEAAQKERIAAAPASLKDGYLKEYKNSLVYVERTLSSGAVRRGLVGAVVLDAYDYEKGSAPDVRPTEGTVKERIPPRVAVRRDSVYEASHVMLFCECPELFDMLTSRKDSLHILYDFDLMQGGGHITGYLVADEALEAEAMIGEYEASRRASGEMMYGVGDGNHSLASAKAYLEELRAAGKDIGGAADALVELVPISERAIVFEPIYKTVSGADTKSLLSFIKERAAKGAGAPVVMYTDEGETPFTIGVPDGGLVCGVLQDAIDAFLAEHGGKCDYIHGKENLIALSKDGTAGFVFDGIEKEDLFPYVSKFGVLPRKAFSMGEACEKRYYTELRLLKK